MWKGERTEQTRENFQARRRNYIGSEWNISSGALHPTKTRKTGGLCNQPLRLYPFVLHPHPPSYGLLTGNLPRLLLTVLSLYSLALRRSDGRPSFLFLASFSAFRPYSGCLVASTSSGFPSCSSSNRPFALSTISSSRRFILRAVRSSLRWHELREVSVTWNPFVCRTLFVVSLQGHFPLRLDRKTEIEMGKV